MSALYLSRARLRPGHQRLAPILFPLDPGHRMSATHRLVWAMFPRDLTDRPFLYREMGGAPGAATELMILSKLPPGDGEGLFDLDTKVFAPKLRAGEKLWFSLRANPTAQKSEVDGSGKRKTRRYDVVMRALKALEKGARCDARHDLILNEGRTWLERQGEKAGFALVEPKTLRIDGYEQFAIDPENRRATGGRRAVHSRLDFDGVLEVNDPALFLTRLADGFGRARAFGHGLMLIRRAQG